MLEESHVVEVFQQVLVQYVVRQCLECSRVGLQPFLPSLLLFSEVPVVASPLLSVFLPAMYATNVMENGHPAAFQLLPKHSFSGTHTNIIPKTPSPENKKKH